MNRGALLIACAMLSARVARATPPGFAVDGAEPAERGSEWYVSDSLDFRGAVRPAVGIAGDYAYGPLILRDTHGARSHELLTDRVVLRAGGTLVLLDRFRLGVLVPVSVFTNVGDPAPGLFEAKPDLALGDIRVSASARLAGRYGDPATLAIGMRAFLPTGFQKNSMSDGMVRMEPHLMFAGRWKSFVYAAGVGFQTRPRVAFAGREYGSEMLYNLALGVKVNDRVVFGPELFGSTLVQGSDAWFEPRTSPLELLIGGHLRLGDDVTIGTSIGRRIDRADTAPSMRVMGVLDYAPDYCVDKDDDHICATEDACPEAEGPRTKDRKTNGCPVDTDGDGVLDQEDVCPNVAGPKSVEPETRGCPARTDPP
jgi:hypothetical protein